jgi:hypothetical protein
MQRSSPSFTRCVWATGWCEERLDADDQRLEQGRRTGLVGCDAAESGDGRQGGGTPWTRLFWGSMEHV